MTDFEEDVVAKLREIANEIESRAETGSEVVGAFLVTIEADEMGDEYFGSNMKHKNAQWALMGIIQNVLAKVNERLVRTLTCGREECEECNPKKATPS